MLSEDGILDALSQAGYRITQPRRAVIRALLEDEGYSCPESVRSRARQYCSTVGLVTVYRTLDLLSGFGFARRIHSEDGCHGYASAEVGHRHHLICRQCGATTEIEGCDLLPFLGRVSQQTGYCIEDHLLEMVGLCAACRRTAPVSSPQQSS